MSEIAKCPLCGKDVKKSIWRPEYEGCAGSVVVTVKCCGMEAVSVPLWNQYAAAMELAKTYVWEKEVVHLKHGNGWPAHISNDGISEIVLHEYKAWEDSKAAKKRVMDLFNNKQ
jgi:hypothetical protein